MEIWDLQLRLAVFCIFLSVFRVSVEFPFAFHPIPCLNLRYKLHGNKVLLEEPIAYLFYGVWFFCWKNVDCVCVIKKSSSCWKDEVARGWRVLHDNEYPSNIPLHFSAENTYLNVFTYFKISISKSPDNLEGHSFIVQEAK